MQWFLTIFFFTSFSIGPVFDVASDIICSALFLSISGGNMLWSFARGTLVEISGFCHSSCSLLNVTTFFWGDLAVVPCPRHFAAVLGRAAGEFVRHGLVDARLDRWSSCQ
jgi:hypothetical protein